MDRSAWLESRTAGASLPSCLYADAVMPSTLRGKRGCGGGTSELPHIVSSFSPPRSPSVDFNALTPRPPFGQVKRVKDKGSWYLSNSYSRLLADLVYMRDRQE